MAETEHSQDQNAPDTVTMAHRFFRDARDHSSEWRIHAREWYAMVAGDQWPADDLFKLQDQQRPAVTFNRILRTINAVTGTQVANRQETRYLPREIGDVQVNEILSAAADWARDNCDAEDEESDAFRDMCIAGMGWTETRMDYTTEPDGDVQIDRTDPIEMYWDPGATKRNLSDARWLMHVRLMPQDEFRERWPDADIELSGAPWEGAEDDTSKRVHVYPQDAYNESQGRRGPKGAQMVRVAHVQWMVAVSSFRVGAKAVSVGQDAFERLKDKLDERSIPYIRQSGIKWKRAFVAGGSLLEEDDSPFPDGPTFNCMTYERDRNENTWFGIVKAMVDPQRFGNKFFSQILDILNKGSKGGVMAESDAVEDFREFEQKWPRPDAVIRAKPGAISGGKIQPKPVVQLPPGLDSLLAFSLDAVHEVTGVSLELLGLADRNQPGVLEGQRKQSGLTILSPLFDALRHYRKKQGRVLLHFIQNFLADGRLIRIVGKQGNPEFVPLAKQADTVKYDVIVDEAPTSPNVKDKVYGALTQMLPTMDKMGIPLPPELLDYAPIPSSLAQKWKEQIAQGQKQQIPPEVQKQMQKLAEENAKLKDKREEMMAKFQIDQAEAQAKAQLDQQAAQVDREKAGAEFSLEQAKVNQEIAIQQAKMAADEQATQAEMALARWKVEQEIAIARFKAQSEAEIKMQHAEQHGEDHSSHSNGGEPMTLNLHMAGKKTIEVKRGKDGKITGAEVNEQ